MRKLLSAFFMAFGLVAGATAQPVSGLIIKLRPSADAASSREQPSALELRTRERMTAVAQSAGVLMQSHRAVGAELRLMRLPNAIQGNELDATLRRLRLHPDVEYAEPDVRMKRMAVPNDRYFVEQWHLGLSSVNPSALNMPSAWNKTTGTAAITVAVLDTGIIKTHPDLVGRFWDGYDFVAQEVINGVDLSGDGNGRDADASDPGDYVTPAESVALGKDTAGNTICQAENSSWHGTFIAGQIAAATNNSAGVAGINWAAKVLPVRVAGKCGAFLSDILDGMRWAAGLSVTGVPNNPNPARIINLSFGGSGACGASYQTVINEVRAAGSLLVVAAGNRQPGGIDNMQLKRPADCQGVLAVGGVQTDGAKTFYSYLGANMGLMAPSGDVRLNPDGSTSKATSTLILSTSNDGTQGPGNNGYAYEPGTSFSAPLAAGVASLMLAINPALTPDALIARMKAGARPHITVAGAPTCSATNTSVCSCLNSGVCGAGMLDADNALALSYAPAAVIAAIAKPTIGSSISLDGSNSAATSGSSIVSYAWSVVSGPAGTIQNSTKTLASVQLSATPADYIFRLVVTDNALPARSGEATLSVSTITETALTSSPAASGGGGGGGGSTGWLWGAGLWLLVGLLWCTNRYKKRPAPL